MAQFSNEVRWGLRALEALDKHELNLYKRQSDRHCNFQAPDGAKNE